MLGKPAPKPCLFVGASRRELQALPEDVRAEIGHALYEAQCGREPTAAKALKGFGGRGVLEVIEDFDGNTYRAVYTVRLRALFTCCEPFRRSRNPASRPRTRKSS
jgi:phage-related protein